MVTVSLVTRENAADSYAIAFNLAFDLARFLPLALQPADPQDSRMSSTALPEDVVRTLCRFLFACIPPGQTVVQLFDPNHGDLYLIRGSDDGEQPSPTSTSDNMFSDVGLRSPPQVLLTELAESLRFAIQNDPKHSAVSTLLDSTGTATDVSEMSFADPGSVGPSDLRGQGHALFYPIQDLRAQPGDAFSPPPPVSPTPHRSGSPLRLHNDPHSHPCEGDASSSSIEGTAGSTYSQPEEPYVTCSSVPPGSFTSEGSPVHLLPPAADGDRSPASSSPSPSPSPSPLKLFGLSSLPTGLSPSPESAGQRSPLAIGSGVGMGMGMGVGVAASRITADFLAIGSPASAGTAASSPTTSTPVCDAMRRALAVMIMHRGNSPRPQARGRGRGARERSVSTSPLARAELVGLPVGEAATCVAAAVKAREKERTRAWATAQASAGAGVPVRFGDVGVEAGVEGSSGDEGKVSL